MTGTPSVPSALGKPRSEARRPQPQAPSDAGAGEPREGGTVKHHELDWRATKARGREARGAGEEG